MTKKQRAVDLVKRAHVRLLEDTMRLPPGAGERLSALRQFMFLHDVLADWGYDMPRGAKR